jgi:pyruvate formate-lyase activating enzyme-like uncharacterized protein
MRLLLSLVALYVAATASATAGELPDRLTFGYESEGEVDATPKACEATVREVVEWSEEDVKKAIVDVCAARKAHVDAYEAVQNSYKNFAKTFGEDTRLNTGEAVEQCLDLGKRLLDEETAWYKAPPETHTRLSP